MNQSEPAHKKSWIHFPLSHNRSSHRISIFSTVDKSPIINIIIIIIIDTDGGRIVVVDVVWLSSKIVVGIDTVA